MRFYARGFIPLTETRRSGNMLAFRYVLFKLLRNSSSGFLFVFLFLIVRSPFLKCHYDENFACPFFFRF